MAKSIRSGRASSRKAVSTSSKHTIAKTHSATAALARKNSSAKKVAKPSSARKGATSTAIKKASRTTAQQTVQKVTKKLAGQLVAMPPSVIGLHWTEKLRDGTHVLVRPIHKSDAAIERTFIERLSPESRHFRFLGYFKSPSDELVKRLTDIDYQRDMAFIALVHDTGEKKEVGVSRYSVAPDGTSCECAVAVADEWHGRGLGALLMRHLIEVARSRGIKKMRSMDSSDNLGMRDLAAYLGFKRQTDPEDARQVLYTLSL